MKNGLDKKKDALVAILTSDPESSFSEKDRLTLLHKTIEELFLIFKSEFSHKGDYHL